MQELLDTYVRSHRLKTRVRCYKWGSRRGSWRGIKCWQGQMHYEEKVCVSLIALLLLGLLYTAICSTGWLIALWGFMVVATGPRVCMCAVHLVSEIQVCLYWRSKESAPSSAILSKIVNHRPDDLDALFLWGSIHPHVYTSTLTCTHLHIHLPWRITCLDCREQRHHFMPTHQTAKSKWNKS